MSQPFTVACIQNRATSDMPASIAECESLCREAAAQGAELLCLPEYCSCLSLSEARQMTKEMFRRNERWLPQFKKVNL